MTNPGQPRPHALPQCLGALRLLPKLALDLMTSRVSRGSHSAGSTSKKDIVGSMQNRVSNCGQEKWFRYLNVYNFDGVANFRDCAGTDPSKAVECRDRAKDAAKLVGKVKRGMLFRTGNLTCATAEDIRRLKDDFKIKTYIDLRCGRVYDNDGLEGVDCDAFDVYAPSPCLIRDEHQPECGFVPRKPGECRRVWINLHEKLQPIDKSRTVTPEDHFGHNCVWTLLDENPKKRLLEVFELLAEEMNYPVMFGCTAGKDRTGVVDLLVKKLLGVDDEVVIEEYLITNLCNGHQSVTCDLSGGAFFKKLRDTYKTDDAIKDALAELHRKQYPTPWSNEMKEAVRKILGKDVKPAELAELAAADQFKKLSEGPTREAVIEWLNSATFLHAQEGSCYISVVRKMLKQLEELGGIERFLDSIGFPSEKQDRVKKILVQPVEGEQ